MSLVGRIKRSTSSIATATIARGSGYLGYGTPMVLSSSAPVYPRRIPTNSIPQLDTQMNVRPFTTQPWQLMVQPSSGKNPPRVMVGSRYQALPEGPEYRFKKYFGFAGPGGVQATSGDLWTSGYVGRKKPAQPPQAGQGPNVLSPLFGRPGFTYVNRQPTKRIGPVLKGSPGTGQTGADMGRSLGYQPTGYGTVQHMPVDQFDYAPATDPYVGIKNEANTSNIPRTILRGNDGIELLGTYRAHDWIQADRFFKQGRSSGMWEDMTFGPDYRFLTEQQQVARYNLYNDIALARQLSPNDYFLGYQTQPAIASQLGGVVGQGKPIGY